MELFVEIFVQLFLVLRIARDRSVNAFSDIYNAIPVVISSLYHASQVAVY